MKKGAVRSLGCSRPSTAATSSTVASHLDGSATITAAPTQMHRRAQKMCLGCGQTWARAQGLGARTRWRWRWLTHRIAFACERTGGMSVPTSTVEPRLRTRGDRSGTWSGPPGARGLHGARAAHAAAGRALSWLHSPCCEAIGARDVANTCIGPATEVGTSSEEAGSWFQAMPTSFTLREEGGGRGTDKPYPEDATLGFVPTYVLPN